MCQECVRSLPEAPSILSITRNTVCVCVSLPVHPPPLRPPDVHSPIIKLVGGVSLHVRRLRPILARDYIHHEHHEGHCVCVFAIACAIACVCECVCVCLHSLFSVV